MRRAGGGRELEMAIDSSEPGIWNEILNGDGERERDISRTMMATNLRGG